MPKFIYWAWTTQGVWLLADSLNFKHLQLSITDQAASYALTICPCFFGASDDGQLPWVRLKWSKIRSDDLKKYCTTSLLQQWFFFKYSGGNELANKLFLTHLLPIKYFGITMPFSKSLPDIHYEINTKRYKLSNDIKFLAECFKITWYDEQEQTDRSDKFSWQACFSVSCYPDTTSSCIHSLHLFHFILQGEQDFIFVEVSHIFIATTGWPKINDEKYIWLTK